MTSDTTELVERVRRRLKEHDSPFKIAGPVPEPVITAAEAALGCTFPPSYRKFLRTFGGITIPTHLGVVHEFVGVSADVPQPPPLVEGEPPPPAPNTDDVVGRTLRAREQKLIAEHLVVVGMGAQYQEWFCLDLSRPTSSGEYPVLLYDARDNALDQQFYDDFGQMLTEVMGFVADNLDHPLD